MVVGTAVHEQLDSLLLAKAPGKAKLMTRKRESGG